MNISPLIAIVPVVLAVALIIIVVRRNITERRPGEPIDIAGAIPAFVVLMVAVIFIGGMASSVAPYSWDEDSGELTVKMNIPHQDVQPWDEYANEVKSLVIQDGVTIGSGAFDSLNSLDYVSIGQDVEINGTAFGMSFIDPMGQDMSNVVSGEYVGYEGGLYRCDPTIFTYVSGGATISGLANPDAVCLVLPRTYQGADVTSVGASSFKDNTTITTVLSLPESHIEGINPFSFQGCSALTVARLPDSLQTISDYAFTSCTALSAVLIPDTIQTIGNYAFRYDPITEINLPEGLTSLGGHTFRDCTSLAEVRCPQTLQSIGNNCFQGCSGVVLFDFNGGITSIGTSVFSTTTSVEQVSFGSGFSPENYTTGTFPWTFYDTDGTTELDKSDASNLAGYTFLGTASALVKVAPGQLTLTPDQIQQVRLHDLELQGLKDQISIDPLPFQPSLQTQEQEPASA